MPSEARAALKAAAQKFVTLEKQIASLEAAAGRANDAVEDAEAELAKYSDLEKQITNWRVSQLKKSASTKSLPDALKARAEAKRVAADELEQCRETIGAIDRELEDTRKKLAAAGGEKDKAAISVMNDTADVIAAELAQINIRRAELLQTLSGLQRLIVKIDGTPVRLGSSSAAIRAMNMPDDCLMSIPGANEVAEMADRWKMRWEALWDDSDAEITIPKAVLPSDYLPGTPATFVQGKGWVGGTPATWKPEAV